ncbi:MAG: thrombospondin type 3 repeat-containing protein [Candidatus Falkowbacteria bacterium]
MFNDLNSANPNGRSAVDDIFAETDKPSVGGPQSDIETHRVGLAVTGENLPPMQSQETGAKKNYLKIIIIIVVVLAVLGGGYFTYSQFFKTSPSDNALVTPPANNPKVSTSTPKSNDTGFVSVVPGASSTATVNPIGEATSTDQNTLNPIATSTPEPVIESTIDSDSDGLTDIEEKISGTNINVIDTDNDGLSDYEEVKIYHSNPLNADTDGDTFLDGAEVKSGYDPNAKGAKLPGNSPIK